MSTTSRHALPRTERRRTRRIAGRQRPVLAVGAVFVVFTLAALTALAPPPQPSEAQARESILFSDAQSLSVSPKAASVTVSRDGYDAVSAVETVTVEGSTNQDWAKLVLLFGGFPVSDSNVTVMLRWMRQENGTNNWWNRNNPLNNGWGSGGGSGLGSYDNLVIAAENAAEALHGNPSYHAIVAGFASSAPTEVIESAIWASPWASSHYNNGSHWAYTPVPVVPSPAGTW
ncbi:hypothetical protein GCM10027416_22370 [Okibacterium endophyticum]